MSSTSKIWMGLSLPIDEPIDDLSLYRIQSRDLATSGCVSAMGPARPSVSGIFTQCRSLNPELPHPELERVSVDPETSRSPTRP